MSNKSQQIAFAREIIQMEAEEVLAMAERLDESICTAAQYCLEALKNERKLVIVGVGKSGNIGKKIAATFNSTGSTAVVLSSQNALHGDLGIVNDGDCILALSYSGETSELLGLLPFLKRSDSRIIAMTGGRESSLAQHSDVVLDTSVSREACPLNLAPTSSSTAMLVMGDALAMSLLEARGFTKEDFAKFHPGGSLGRALLTRVDDIMRGGDQLAVLEESASVNEAIQSMSEHRCGACILTRNSGELSGIFTHGDFARSYQANAKVGSHPVKQHMSSGPLSIQSGSLAAEAVKLLEKHRVDDLIVIDDKAQPIGLIDSQDLARLKLI